MSHEVRIRLDYTEEDVLNLTLYNVWRSTSSWIESFNSDELGDKGYTTLYYTDPTTTGKDGYWKERQKRVRMKNLRDALNALAEAHLTHCGVYSVTEALLNNDADACVSDMAMQYVVFNDVIFG